MSDTIRSFIAIELSAPAQQALTALQGRLKTISPPHAVRWTAIQNIHLTLHFLGDVTADRLEPIQAAMRAAAETVPPFALRLGGLGCFPNTSRPRVIWVGLTEANSSLSSLHAALGQKLAEAIDFAPETRPFSPHLTLGRVKSGIPKRHLPTLSQALQQEQRRVGKLADLPVTEICLFQSELRPTGAVYTRLFSSPLTANRE
ncbi:MAG: RNA 2',3'-cyclic phosphodiesterase [Anaerolineae bacterium]